MIQYSELVFLTAVTRFTLSLCHFIMNGLTPDDDDNPQAVVVPPLLPQKVTVYCSLSVHRITGPYFFKNKDNHNVMASGKRFSTHITLRRLTPWQKIVGALLLTYDPNCCKKWWKRILPELVSRSRENYCSS